MRGYIASNLYNILKIHNKIININNLTSLLKLVRSNRDVFSESN
jgi:hypothetical protein